MRILVTGGTGFIGSNIVAELLRLGHDVIITGHDAEQKIPEFKGVMLQPSFVGLDWSSLGQLDAIVHEAAINDTQSQNSSEMMRANVDSSLALFEYAAKNGCKNIVYASSTAVYGDGPVPYSENQAPNPLTPYAKSKKVLEEKAVEFGNANPGIVIVGLRYCNVYGPGESHKEKRASMVYQIAQQMKKGSPRLFKSGEQKRDYIYIKDAVRANILALKARKSTVVNCGSGTATSFNDLVRILNGVLVVDRKPEYFENPFASSYQSHTECDMSRAKEKLGFVPTYTIESGIAEYMNSGSL